jgi:hypothetical protein
MEFFFLSYWIQLFCSAADRTLHDHNCEHLKSYKSVIIPTIKELYSTDKIVFKGYSQMNTEGHMLYCVNRSSNTLATANVLLLLQR